MSALERGFWIVLLGPFLFLVPGVRRRFFLSPATAKFQEAGK